MSGTFLDTSIHAAQFPSLLTVQEHAPGDANGRGVTDPGDWNDVDGLTDLPCLVFGIQAQEVPLVEGAARDQSISTHTILTKDYWPAITNTQRGVIDGNTYDFLACDHEGMETVGVIKAKRYAA